MLAAQVQTRLVLQGKLRLTQSSRNRPKSVIKSLKTDCCILNFSVPQKSSHGLCFRPRKPEATEFTRCFPLW